MKLKIFQNNSLVEFLQGHSIKNSSDTTLTQRNSIKIEGIPVVDDSTNNQTIVKVARELTMAQYNALSSAEKNNGEEYFVTDAPGGGSGVPDGGTTGQALIKNSNTDGDVTWGNVATPTSIATKANESIITDAYSSSKNYAVGDYCIYNNGLYKCKSACTNVLPTNTTYWTSTQIISELGSGGTSDWTYAGTITKTNNYVSGSLISGCYVVLPDAAKELLIIVDPTKAGFTSDTFLYESIIPILSFEDTGVIYYGGFKQGCFGVRMNYQLNPVKNKKSIVIWTVYDRNGTATSDGANCEGKVYYR